MKRLTLCLALSAMLVPLPTIAVELQDCKLDQGNFPGKALRGFAMKSQERYFMEVEGALKNGTENSYERDEAVLNVDMKVVRTTLAMMPTADIKLKSSWAFSQSFSFAKSRPLKVWNVAELPDGRRFALLGLNGGATLFLDEANQICNKALTISSDGQIWQLGTLSAEPENVPFERSLVDDVVKTGSLRIIYLGATAGAMRFQEVWVQGSRIGKSITRTFDQFAKSIDIAGFKFDVVEVKGEKLKLRYDIASRTEISTAQVGQISLMNQRD